MSSPRLRLSKRARLLLGVPAVLVFVGVYAPILLSIALSFQGPLGGVTLPISEPTLMWYESLIDLRVITEHPAYQGQPLTDFRPSIVRSLALAATTALVSTFLALMAAQAYRTRFRGHSIIAYTMIIALVMPGLALSVGMVSLAGELGVEPGLFVTGLPIHVTWTLPFCFIFLVVMFRRFDRRLEESAYTLGATRLKAWLHVTFPVMRPAIAGSLLFAFMLSLDEFARSIFIMGSDRTLPLALVSAARIRVTPSLFALGIVFFLTAATLVAIYVVVTIRSLRRNLPTAGPSSAFE